MKNITGSRPANTSEKQFFITDNQGVTQVAPFFVARIFGL
jgi:hypothetical protein